MMVIDGVFVSLDGMLASVERSWTSLKLTTDWTYYKCREEARQAGKAPPVDLQATNIDALQTVDLDVLMQYDINNKDQQTDK